MTSSQAARRAPSPPEAARPPRREGVHGRSPGVGRTRAAHGVSGVGGGRPASQRRPPSHPGVRVSAARAHETTATATRRGAPARDRRRGDAGRDDGPGAGGLDARGVAGGARRPRPSPASLQCSAQASPRGRPEDVRADAGGEAGGELGADHRRVRARAGSPVARRTAMPWLRDGAERRGQAGVEDLVRGHAVSVVVVRRGVVRERSTRTAARRHPRHHPFRNGPRAATAVAGTTQSGRAAAPPARQRAAAAARAALPRAGASRRCSRGGARPCAR